MSPEKQSDFFAPREIQTPSGPRRDGQPVWNKQRGSQLPVERYLTFAEEVENIQLPDRTWPDKKITHLSLIHISEPTRPVCSSRMPSSA